MRRLRAQSVRTRLLLAVLGAVAVAVAAMTVGFNLLLARSLSHNASDVARARAAAQLAALRPAKGVLQIGEAPDEAVGESQFWVFSGGRTLEAPRSSPAVADAARSLQGGRSRFLDVNGADMRLFCERGIPCVMFGTPGLERAHAVDEYVEIDELVEAARIYTVTALNFLEA